MLESCPPEAQVPAEPGRTSTPLISLLSGSSSPQEFYDAEQRATISTLPRHYHKQSSSQPPPTMVHSPSGSTGTMGRILLSSPAKSGTPKGFSPRTLPLFRLTASDSPSKARAFARSTSTSRAVYKRQGSESASPSKCSPSGSKTLRSSSNVVEEFGERDHRHMLPLSHFFPGRGRT